ncbi:hypothetical protein F5888DRAFT_1794308 [Russula emetica]|nr:hypothetical protein F5888DRAFT_1794308 [Russula emetica]
MTVLTRHRAELLLTAGVTAVATYSLLSLYHSRSRRSRRADLADQINRALASGAAETRIQPSPSPSPPIPNTEPAPDPDPDSDYEEELVREQLARNYAFLREDGVSRVRAASVVIVGCGGVGSWTAVMLARSGVAKLRLVDFDYVTLSSLNRHATAALADVGTPKVQCIARALRAIAPFVRVDPRVELWRGDEDGAELLRGADWVVDAIDNIGTKVELLAYCVQNNIKVFSSMGAGAKSDPTRIQIADLSATHYDPLARAVPREYSIPVVYSTEVPSDVALLPLPDAELTKGSVDELAPLRDFRVRILPVLGPLPGLFGLHIATYGRPLERPLPVRHRKKLYERMWKDLLHPLIRWDPRAPLSLENCVVAEMKEVGRAMQSPEEVWGTEASHVAQSRIAQARRFREWALE